MSTCRGYCGRRQVQREGTEGAGCTNVPSHVDAPDVKNEGSATGASFLKGQAHRWPPVMRGWQRVQDEHAERRGLDCGRCSGDRRNLPDCMEPDLVAPAPPARAAPSQSPRRRSPQWLAGAPLCHSLWRINLIEVLRPLCTEHEVKASRQRPEQSSPPSGDAVRRVCAT